MKAWQMLASGCIRIVSEDMPYLIVGSKDNPYIELYEYQYRLSFSERLIDGKYQCYIGLYDYQSQPITYAYSRIKPREQFVLIDRANIKRLAIEFYRFIIRFKEHIANYIEQNPGTKPVSKNYLSITQAKP